MRTSLMKSPCAALSTEPAIAAMHGPHSLVRFGDQIRFSNFPPTLVEGDYSNGFVCPYVLMSVRPSVRPSIDTILSPQHPYSFQGILMKFSRYCCHDLKMCIFYRGHARLILPELWPFVSFSHFINRNSCLRNSSYISHGILMKLSRYCSHDPKRIILYRGHA